MSCVVSSVTKKVNGSVPDIISNLPDVILENILMRMPLRDAVRTSILSRKWRYSWVMLQHLVFDDTLCEISTSLNDQMVPQNKILLQKKILLIIYQVLHRIQTVHKVCLSSTTLESCPEIDNLIIGLASAQIEDFTLHIWHGDAHKLPMCLFSYQKLSHLDLRNCVFSQPVTFRGFSMLVSLELVEVCITEDSFMRLISSCPLLENLKFITYQDTTYGHIEIDSPSLKILKLSGIFKSVCFKNTSRLGTVSLCLKERANQVERVKEDRFFSNIPALENLEIDGYYMKSLIAGLMKLSLSGHLKILKLCGVCFDIPQEFILSIWLALTPKLQILRIQMSYPGELNSVVEFPDRLREYWFFPQLREVFVDSVVGTSFEIEFLKVILTRSKVLEKVFIKPHRDAVDNGFTILKGLSGCERLSPKAKIIIGGSKW